MSLPPGWRLLGLHLESFQASVNCSVYLRLGSTGACARPPGVSGLAQASRVEALLPSVVRVGCPVDGAVSHGPGSETLTKGPVLSVQPAPGNQQPITELVGFLFAASDARLGLALNRRQRGPNCTSPASGGPWSLVVTMAA